MNDRERYEAGEKGLLAPYAQLSKTSLGRRHKEDPCSFRPCFYRDVGRIVHSTAFRLLEYKTQVFVNHEGDYYRTRLTHSLEVAQMSRGVARILGLNEDLAETIALAHDLGHTPFGHSGEVALNNIMADDGGFEHNVQSYRVVTRLEERYPDFIGLNLSYEVLEGILTHTTQYDQPKKMKDFQYVGFPTLEAQIVNYTDEIAFMNHDLDDGIHWGMLSIESLKDVDLWAETWRAVEKEIPNAPARIKRCRAISGLINELIDDLQLETKRRIAQAGIKTLDDVRLKGKNIVSLSDSMVKRTSEAKEFLFRKVYRHPEVVKMAEIAGGIIDDLFKVYLQDPKLLPEKYSTRFLGDGSKRHISDYIAGMTDRFAFETHNRLIGKTTNPGL
jgi:dGTPase